MILTQKIKDAIFDKAKTLKNYEEFINISFLLVSLYDDDRYTEDEVIKRLCN